MDSPPVIDRLVALPTLADIPREQLNWLIDHGEIHRADDGARFFGVAGVVGLFLVISGRFSVLVNQGGVEREVREITSGRVTGHLPFSRMAAPRGYLVADGPVEFLCVRIEDLRAMTRDCYEFTSLCVHEMLERVRDFKADDKRQEKMAALGRLSAGLAHELNNPASAAARAARELEAARMELAAAARDLGAAGIAAGAWSALEALESATEKTAGEVLSPLDRAEAEERLVDWLDDRGIAPDLADPLVACGLTVADLDAVIPALGAGQLGLALRYLAADRTARGLIADISSATERVHSLVAAVKAHTQMDRAPTTAPTRLAEHLTDTVTLMSGKATHKRVSVELTVDADLPPVAASVAELNQVWLHLLDNAIDAVAPSGRVVVDARRDKDRVIVRVIDDGPGIPDELRERVFEPFFTTKDVGEGRGLGLDVVRSVVRSHRGTVELASVPGRTEFRVGLPAGAGDDG
jgi:C4-dicarboxylate-specific signal transduction histidine kinase